MIDINKLVPMPEYLTLTEKIFGKGVITKVWALSKKDKDAALQALKHNLNEAAITLDAAFIECIILEFNGENLVIFNTSEWTKAEILTDELLEEYTKWLN